MNNIKFFIILCITFYTPTIDSITENQIKKLWNKIIKIPGSQYITVEKFLDYYNGHDEAKFRAITELFGTVRTESGESKMIYNEFKYAALAGLIPNDPSISSTLRENFDEIAKQPNALYITKENLEKHYGISVNRHNKFNNVFPLGGLSEGEWRLYFAGYKKCVYLGYLLDDFSYPDTDVGSGDYSNDNSEDFSDY